MTVSNTTYQTILNNLIGIVLFILFFIKGHNTYAQMNNYSEMQKQKSKYAKSAREILSNDDANIHLRIYKSKRILKKEKRLTKKLIRKKYNIANNLGSLIWIDKRLNNNKKAIRNSRKLIKHIELTKNDNENYRFNINNAINGFCFISYTRSTPHFKQIRKAKSTILDCFFIDPSDWIYKMNDNLINLKKNSEYHYLGKYIESITIGVNSNQTHIDEILQSIQNEVLEYLVRTNQIIEFKNSMINADFQYFNETIKKNRELSHLFQKPYLDINGVWLIYYTEYADNSKSNEVLEKTILESDFLQNIMNQ